MNPTLAPRAAPAPRHTAIRHTLTLLALLAGPAQAGMPAWAAEPVRSIPIHVHPHYDSRSAPPMVAVWPKIDALLASPRREDILAARDAVQATPDFVSPQTLMVLAVRLYDVGLRDDAVVWFYAAKDRFSLAEAVLAPGVLAMAKESVVNFSLLAGPIFNGYAFCDLARQRQLRDQSLEWVVAHPYLSVFAPGIAARPGDRKALYAKALESMRARLAAERADIDSPAFMARFRQARADNEADAKYCW